MIIPTINKTRSHLVKAVAVVMGIIHSKGTLDIWCDGRQRKKSNLDETIGQTSKHIFINDTSRIYKYKSERSIQTVKRILAAKKTGITYIFAIFIRIWSLYFNNQTMQYYTHNKHGHNNFIFRFLSWKTTTPSLFVPNYSNTIRRMSLSLIRIQISSYQLMLYRGIQRNLQCELSTARQPRPLPSLCTRHLMRCRKPVMQSDDVSRSEREVWGS